MRSAMKTLTVKFAEEIQVEDGDVLEISVNITNEGEAWLGHVALITNAGWDWDDLTEEAEVEYE